MKIAELTDYLEYVAPLRFQEAYDNAGLITGDPAHSVIGIMVSLDATEEVIQDAINQGCNVVVSHHPIVFRGIKQFDVQNYVHRAVIKAIKNDVALYAIHTNLDNVLQNGVNEKIAEKIGLVGLNVLSPKPQSTLEEDHVVGSGVLGQWETPKSPSEALQWIKDHMNVKMIKHTELLDRSIQEVAVCGGAGSFLLPEARRARADLFITADYKYHEFFDADEDLMIADIGHYESEYYTIELLGELISKKFPKFAPRYTKVNTNPVRYF